MNENLKAFGAAISVRADTVECIEHSLYDTVVFPREEFIDRLEFFSVPIGKDHKTDADTSMFLPNRLPAPQLFFISGVALTVLEDRPTEDVWEILRTGVFNLLIGAKLYMSRSPLSSLYVMPEGLLSSAHRIEPGLGLLINQNFRVTLHWPRPVSRKRPRAHSIRVNLNGHLFRPVA